MFDPTCSRCGKKVLLGFRSLEGVENTSNGINMVFRCHCGAPAFLHTGTPQPR